MNVRLTAVLALVSLSSLGARAADLCTKDGISLFPAPGAVVPTNVQFFIEGTGEVQTRVQELLGSDVVRLVATGHDAIPLKPEKGFVSQMGRVAVRLKPLKALEANVEYTLALPPSMSGVTILNDRLGGSLRWLAGVGPDKKSPQYRQKPSSSEGLYVKDLNGLRRQLKLRTQVEEMSSVYFLVSMERARGGSARQQYPVFLDTETLTVGHDACNGNFAFDDGRAYRLTFELFDAAGNKSNEKASLEVSAPRPL